ncbi:choice-of-anchor L domain-containing protein [Lacinutrix mariniflava]|uniref:choice-of-anchor L domain-containing protein n=1 Tax=Lacinutrix mariniflava TaxID=342955 RepID=UPI0006E46606|nr:choice-of-anchor L domain-containing protein [Lacinutrix mariniflava]
MKKTTLLLILLFLSLSINAQITTYPYSEDFEAGDGGWIADNATNGTWTLGTPAATIINSAASGVNSWTTNLTGDYNNSDNSTVTSPVFDFSALAAPAISLSIWWESENSWDGTVLQSSIDGGTTWINVGAFGDSGNWFTDDSIGGNPGGQQEGWTGSGGGWVTASHALTGLEGQASVQLRFAFGSDTSFAEEGVSFDDISVFEVTCPAPTDLTLVSTTATDASLSWTAGPVTAWEIVVQAPGTGLPSAAGTATTNNPHVEMGLTPATDYEAYVRSDCGGEFSDWVGPINFATECTTFVAPYTEGFENAGTIPLCWTMDGGEIWEFADNGGFDHIGTNGTLTGSTATNGYFAWVDSSGTEAAANLTTPLIDVSGLTTPAITFYEISDNEGDANSQLDVEVWDGAAWNLMATYNTNTSGWEQRTINISTLTITGDVQARFIFSELVPGDFSDDIAIDDVTFDELPSCVNPSNLVLDSVSATEANLSWVSNGMETDWEVVVQTQGTGAPTGAGIAVNTTPTYQASTLTPITDYEFYVRSNCGSEFSDWIGPLNFTTECAAFIPDYLEDFATIPADCWDEADSGDATTGPGDIGAGSWNQDGFLNNGFQGAYSINLWLATKSDWLLSPLFDLTGGPFQAEFDLGVMDFGSTTVPGILGSDDIVQILISTDLGATWTILETWDSTTVFPVTGLHPVYDLTAYSGQTVQFGILGSEGTVDDAADNEAFVDNFQVRATPNCPDVANLVFNSSTATTANLTWDIIASETGWEVSIQAPGTGIPTVAGTATTDNAPYVAMGLTPATDYEAYVRTVCGTDLGTWVGPVNFTTECTTFIAPYTEGFENAGTIPLCWTMDGGEDWEFADNGGIDHIGNDGTLTGSTATNNYFAWVDSSGDDGPSTLTTPFVDVSPLAAPTLSFYEISDNEGNANSTLDVEVWDGAAWNPMGTYNTNTSGWEEIFIDLSGLTITGDVQARFIFSETTGDFYDDIAIDDVTFDEAPSCFDPTATYTIIDDCLNGNQFLIDVDVTYFGGATSVSIQDNQGGTLVSVIPTTGVTQFGPYPLNTDVIFTVSSEQDTCFSTSQTYNIPTCPPANDNCGNAISVTANADGNCTNFVSGTLYGATESPQANPCTGTANDDVWYTFSAINADQVISFSNIVGPTTFLSHGLYEGPDCDNLTNLYCSTANESIANGLTVGNTYYIRVFTFNDDAFQDVNFDLCVYSIPPPITTDVTQYTVTELIEDILVNSPCSTISNVTSSSGSDFGTDTGIGYFEANGSGFPFESGIIMTTGNALNAPGPETGILSDGGGGFPATWPGDADLEAEINEGTTNNASIIEFDFVPFIEDMSFEFIFAAEEYGTFQCGFSDAFAFLLTDTVTGVTTNIAVVPGTTTPVSVFTIRDDAFNGSCPSSNPALFDAYYGNGGLPALTNPTNFIGRTVPLTAMSTVVPNRTYHIKLVIADDGDTAYDSAVFLKAGSFEIGEVDLGEDILLTGGNANCEGDNVLLDIGVPVGDNATITWYTMENGIQEPILDAAGVPENGITLEVTETNNYIVEIVLNANASCFVIDEILVEFFPNPIANPAQDILGCDDDGDGLSEYDLTINDAVISGSQTDVTVTYYETEQDAIDGTNAILDPVNYVSMATTIYYRIANGITSCSENGSFNLTFGTSPETSFDTAIVYEVCPNASAPITVTAIGDNYTEADVTIAWYNEGVLVSGQTDLSIDNVLTSGTYTIEVMFNETGCTASEDVFVEELETCVIPQGISPNGDGLNETFDLSSFDVQVLTIFNRNGVKVYEKTNYLNEWYGQSLDGDELPTGTYYYVMNYQGNKTKAAWVYINRENK